jgi:2-polyprenyl-3-methyl-5-hydroxy-6-metoxy-1,4-benzoquinol methylase
MISEALKRKAEANVTNVSFSQGTIFNDDLVKPSFDKITAFSIIHLLEDREKVIRRICELLKPGGLFISETACFKDRMDLKTRLGLTLSRFLRLPGAFLLHLNMFKTSDVEQLIKSQNFNIVKAGKLFFNGMTIIFVVAKKY